MEQKEECVAKMAPESDLPTVKVLRDVAERMDHAQKEFEGLVERIRPYLAPETSLKEEGSDEKTVQQEMSEHLAQLHALQTRVDYLITWIRTVRARVT
jgi:hypothetical protein